MVIPAYPTLQEKADALEGTILTHDETLQILKNYE